MPRHSIRFVLFFLLVIALVAACGGRTLTAWPGADGAGGQGASGDGGDITGGGGSGASSGTGGTGGTAGTGGTGGTAGTGGTSPLDCIGCIIMNCPETLDCITDPACLQGVACSVTQCLSGGQPDMMCVVGCFDGDMDAALNALQTLTCIFGDCADQCGGMLPF